MNVHYAKFQKSLIVEQFQGNYLKDSTSSQKAPHSIPSKPGGKSDNCAFTTDDQWKLELPSILDDSGSEMNSMYS